MDYDDLDYDVFYDVPYEEAAVDYLSSLTDSYTLKNLWDDCLVLTITDGLSAVYTIFICCFILRFTACLSFLPMIVVHLTSGSLGLYCLHHMFAKDAIYVVILAAFGYSCLVFSCKVGSKYCGIITALTCVLFLILCELFFVEKVSWHKVRGSQMVVTMKVISLALDIDREDCVLPSLDECFGYLFAVGNVIFGPWISFSTYTAMSHQSNKNIAWAFKTIQSAVLAFFFLTISTCWSSWFLQYTSWKWLGAYRDALSFRFSHYFVCFISESLSVASGLSTAVGTWGLPVAYPHKIEMPRSLNEVVTSWNLPMHTWLKKYVFKTVRPLGNFCAYLLTFAASSLLHGLNFQLAAVLLSLGFYSCIECELRKKLAMIFDACILHKSCLPNCDHVYKKRHPGVIMTNIAFGILAVFHLAYLGVMFDSSSSIQEEGYNMQHTLGKWSELDYASFWVALACGIFYWLI